MGTEMGGEYGGREREEVPQENIQLQTNLNIIQYEMSFLRTFLNILAFNFTELI